MVFEVTAAYSSLRSARAVMRLPSQQARSLSASAVGTKTTRTPTRHLPLPKG